MLGCQDLCIDGSRLWVELISHVLVGLIKFPTISIRLSIKRVPVFQFVLLHSDETDPDKSLPERISAKLFLAWIFWSQFTYPLLEAKAFAALMDLRENHKRYEAGIPAVWLGIK